MIRINVDKNVYKKIKGIVKQEEITRVYDALVKYNNKTIPVSIRGSFTLTGETLDFYEVSNFQWETTNDFNGQWNPQWNKQGFLNGNYSLDDYVDDEIIQEIIEERNTESDHKYYITNLPPASEISMNNPVNMEVEHEYDGINKEITPAILEVMDWRKYYSPDPNGLGTQDPLKLVGEIISHQKNTGMN